MVKKLKHDLIGKRFNRLLVVKQDGLKQYKPYKTKSGRINLKTNVLWLCKCDCGDTITAITNHLMGGNVQSCGCLDKELKKSRLGILHPRWKGHEKISGSFWCRAVRGAISRGHVFEITKEYAWDLLEKQEFKCALSGVPIKIGAKRCDLKAGSTTASLDRIDNNKGYIEGNIQWLHSNVNYMKQDLSQDEFIDFCKKIALLN